MTPHSKRDRYLPLDTITRTYLDWHRRHGVRNTNARAHQRPATPNARARIDRIDWAICLAWSLGQAVLTALVNRTAANAAITYDAIRCNLAGSNTSHRWIGRCKSCSKAHRVDGVLVIGRSRNQDDQLVMSGIRAYRTADHGSNPTALFISCSCCETRVKLQRVYDAAKPTRPRHECDAKCLAATGPACECKCRGTNHGSGASA